GDWTLVGGFRKELGNRVRFVEATYPRTVSWSLEEHAIGVEEALAREGIACGWLLGESFSSQVTWLLLARQVLEIEGLILAGGFVRHPWPWVVPLAERTCATLPMFLIHWAVWWYGKLARWRFRRDSETLAGLAEFVARRTQADRWAGVHRLRLLRRGDIPPIAGRAAVPVYALTGAFDPVVPWPWVRSWLTRHCRGLRQYKIIWYGDHNILASAPRASARLVLGWMGEPDDPTPPRRGLERAKLRA